MVQYMRINFMKLKIIGNLHRFTKYRNKERNCIKINNGG